MRCGSRKRLCVLSVAAAGAVGLFGGWGASAAATARTVPLRVDVIGSGTVRVPGNHPFTCRANSCNHTFHVLRGRRISVRAVPFKEWKLKKWKWPCEGSAATCTLLLKSRQQLDVVFLAPGDFSNPIKLAKAAMLVRGWRLKVNSATLNADTEVEAVIDPWTGLPANPPPQPGNQYTLVNVSMTNVKSPSGNLAGYLKNGVEADDEYTQGCTPPPLDLGSVSQVQSGQTVTGNLCFEIVSGAAATLMLDAPGRLPGGVIWFALRQFHRAAAIFGETRSKRVLATVRTSGPPRARPFPGKVSVPDRLPVVPSDQVGRSVLDLLVKPAERQPTVDVSDFARLELPHRHH